MCLTKEIIMYNPLKGGEIGTTLKSQTSNQSPGTTWVYVVGFNSRPHCLYVIEHMNVDLI